MMKEHIFTILMLAMALTVSAQTSTQARSLLDKTAAVIGNAGGVSASFSATGDAGEASGTIIVKGSQFRINTPQATMWFNGKTQWVYFKSTEEVNVTTPTETQQQLTNPYKLISLYKSGYDLSSEKLGAGYQIHMVAQNESKPIKEVYVTVNGKYEPTKLRLRTSAGWSTVNISNLKSGNYTDSTFQFSSKDYPDAEIIDLR